MWAVNGREEQDRCLVVENSYEVCDSRKVGSSHKCVYTPPQSIIHTQRDEYQNGTLGCALPLDSDSTQRRHWTASTLFRGIVAT